MTRDADPVSRREFLVTVGAAAGGLMIGIPLAGAASGPVRQGPWGALDTVPDEINAWLVIAENDAVTIRIAQSEMGEGVFTAMAMMVAEELECDWAKVRPEYASANRSIREHNIYGRMQTGGSSAVRLSRVMLQQAGASARVRLVQAAAERWGVPAAECAACQGVVTHQPSGRHLRYGQVAAAAARIALLAEPAIKTPDQYRLMGRPVARLDTPQKVDGRAIYGLDVRIPGMLYAAVRHCPMFGGVLKGWDAAGLAGRAGIHSVQPVPGGVAVVADSTWRAISAVRALVVTWSDGPQPGLGQAALDGLYQAALDREGTVARNDGDAVAALAAKDAALVSRLYEVPFLAHAAMEPLNCTAQVGADRVDLWVGTQVPEQAIKAAAEAAGVAPEAVHLHNCFLGGGFGRRLLPDEIPQAVIVAKAVGRPVKLVWTREEDMQHDRYRPRAGLRFDAVLGPGGAPAALRVRSAVGSIRRSTGADPILDGLDHFSLDGIEKMPHAIPDLRVELSICDSPVPIGPWRSVNASQNGFGLESFIDELAVAAGQDPYLYRRALLAGRPDWIKALDTAAEKGDWGKPLPKGRGRGIAIFECYGSVVAEVVEVTVSRKGQLAVDRVVAAIDCGHVVNPRILESQLTGAVVYGLSAALHGEITIDKGAAIQSNFGEYDVVRHADMPEVEVHLALTGGAKWGGGGEPGLPPLAPALANAVFAATGKRVRRLPFKNADLSWSD